MLDKAGIRIDLADGAFVRVLNINDMTDDYVAALNDPSILENMVAGTGRDETHETIRSYIQENAESPDSLLFGLFTQNGTLLGTSRLHGIAEKFTWIGVLLFRPESRGKGWGTQLVRAVSNYALINLHKDCVRAGIYQRNESSRKCFQRAGFSHENNDEAYVGPIREIWVKVREMTDEDNSCI